MTVSKSNLVVLLSLMRDGKIQPEVTDNYVSTIKVNK